MRMLLFVVCLACSAPLAPARPADEVYTSKEGGYSAKFPGTPKEATKNQPGPTGEVKVYLAYYGTSNGAAFLTSHNDYPGKPTAGQVQKVLDAVVKGASSDGKLVESKDVEFGEDKLPARAYRVDKPKLSVRGVVVYKGDRVYQAIVSGPKDFVGGKDATAFLDSFTLTK